MSPKDCTEKDKKIWETCLPSLPSLWSVLASQHKHSRLANQTQLPHCCHGLKTSTSPSSTRPGAGAAFLFLSLCSSTPDFPSYPPCPTHRGSSLASLTCLHFLRSPLFSRVHCFLLCMSLPYGNKTHSQLVTKARKFKTMQSLLFVGYGGSVASSITCKYGLEIKWYLAQLTAASLNGDGMRLQVDSYM